MFAALPSAAAVLVGEVPRAPQTSGVVALLPLHLEEINLLRAGAQLPALSLPQLQAVEVRLGAPGIAAAKASAAAALLQRAPAAGVPATVRDHAADVAARPGGLSLERMGEAVAEMTKAGADDPARMAETLDRFFEGTAEKDPSLPPDAAGLTASFLMDQESWAAHRDGGTVPREWVAVNEALRSKIRTGWTKRGVPDGVGETVWEHSRKVYEAALIYASNHPEIDARKAGLMALFHDVAEYRAPDFTPGDVSAEEKARIERRAMDHLVEALGADAAWIRDLWLEYEEGRSPEAKLVFQLDKFDPAVQALRYERMGYPVQNFYPYTRARLTDLALIRTFEALMEKDPAGGDPYRRYFAFLALDGDRRAVDRRKK